MLSDIENEDIKQNYKEEKKQKILDFINSDFYKLMTLNDIISFMEIPEKDRNLFFSIVKDLLEEGKIIKTKKNKIAPLKMFNIVCGIYNSNSKGFGFVTPDEDSNLKEDIFISSSLVNNAMHKDKVLVQLKNKKVDNKKVEGEIIKVLEKAYNLVVGTFEKNKSFGFVIPDEKRLLKDIFIPKNKSRGAITGHKVLVKITKAPNENKKPEGIVIEILGHKNDPEVEILSIIKQFELPTDFSFEVYKQIEKLPDYVYPEEIKKRVDLRRLKTVTIDGEDAKDLDDAISIEKMENGNFKLGVHIADVTHYVKENTVLDKEALNRGTSIYLVDRVIPMLPHKLSNGICSLNEGVDRLALSCIMEINREGIVLSSEIYESVIKVDKRMSYTEVSDLLINSNSKFLDENLEFITMFKQMNELRDILFKKRNKRGSIEFDFKEVKIILNENRVPIDIIPYERSISTSIIEEFMLIANETIAEQFFWLDIPFIYRTHEKPDEEKIEKLTHIISKFNYFLKGNSTYSKSFQKLLLKCKNTSEETLINRLVLRSLKQARYTSENNGHFGLAAKYYCHFTSPIRRYPDLQIHRIIKYYLNNILDENKIKSLEMKMPIVAQKCSDRERVADEVEREVEQLKKVEFMKDKIGQIFRGIISHITSWGIYVELSNTIEGMVSIKCMYDDNYFYDEENIMYIGQNTNKTYSLGDNVRVILTKVNMQDKNIDFEFYE